jgi:hypothetical protein
MFDASAYNERLIEAVLESPSVASTGRLCVQVCRYHRAIGTCALLIDADVDSFFHGLLRSALTWRWYLESALGEGRLDHPARIASFTAPFVDALSADRPRIAADIAKLAPAEWRPDYEYEDDFLFARFLHALGGASAPDESELASTLEAWDRALEGGEDSRLPICKALLERDSEGFDEAFRARIQARDAEFSKRANPEGDGADDNDYDFVPNWRIWVEGLALLRLAEGRGLEVAAEYPTCPSIARVREYAPLPRAAFPPRSSSEA